MMPVQASTAAAPRPTRPRSGASVGFAMPPDAPAPSAQAEAAHEPVCLGGILALQEVSTPQVIDEVTDRRARRHGQTMLLHLAGLQRAILCGDAGPDRLHELRLLLDEAPQAADPGLRAALEAVALRVRVELARRDPGMTNP